jgi:hypothetical protein
VRSTLANKRFELVSAHGVANPLHSIFDRIENLPKPSLVALGALHGLQLGQYNLTEPRTLLRGHVSSGKCGLHKFGYRQLGCADLLKFSSPTPSEFPDFDPVTIQIAILESVVGNLSTPPLKTFLRCTI